MPKALKGAESVIERADRLTRERRHILRLISSRVNRTHWLRRRTGLHERTVQRRINELIGAGLIEVSHTDVDVTAFRRVFALTDLGKASLARDVPVSV